MYNKHIIAIKGDIIRQKSKSKSRTKLKPKISSRQESSLKPIYKKIFLVIDGVILIILGAFAFLSLAGMYIYSKGFGSLEILVMIGIAVLTLLLIFTGVSLIRRNRHGGMIAAVLLGLGTLGTFSSYVMLKERNIIYAFCFYSIALVLLILGWKELK
ncbi:MAG: hypothetical protein NT001_05100 [Candidatus Woesearchaeota archaeon]|nr:hypothetical protein [Candidatus Woesearchaeota archaeon]